MEDRKRYLIVFCHKKIGKLKVAITYSEIMTLVLLKIQFTITLILTLILYIDRGLLMEYGIQYFMCLFQLSKTGLMSYP